MINSATKTAIAAMFHPLARVAAGQAFPPPRALSLELGRIVDRARSDKVAVAPKISSLFATAAVEIWHRAIHSFLISAALTEASPIWASVSGYYSSHYAVRAFAHLLGFFQLYSKKKVARLTLQEGRHVIEISKKKICDREHKFYWTAVKSDSFFTPNPWFSRNELVDGRFSDVAHRDRANYADHLKVLPVFHALKDDYLRRRIEFISEIEFSTPTIPSLEKFPDIDAVQVIAYHRMVGVRQFLDEILAAENRFWRVHRTPGFCVEMIDFQATASRELTILRAQP